MTPSHKRGRSLADGLNEAEEVLGLEPEDQRGTLGSKIQALKLAWTHSSCTLDPLWPP